MHSVVASEFDIIGIAETWLRPGVFDAELFPETFRVYRSDRRFGIIEDTQGGGVLLGVSRGLLSEQIDLTDFISNIVPIIDILCCKIFIGSQSLYIFTLYIPPRVTVEDLEQFLEQFTTLFRLFESNVLILGDFNVPAYTDTNAINRKRTLLVGFIEMFSMVQLNRVLNVNDRLLDLVLANFDCSVFKNDIPLVKEDVYHPSLAIELIITFEKNINFQISSNLSKEYNFRKADFLLLYNLIFNTDWTPVFNSANVNSACKELYLILDNIFDICVPQKVKRRRRFPNYYTRDLINNILKKEKAYKDLKKYKTNFYREKYKSLRLRVKGQIQYDYKTFLFNSERNISNDPSNFWAFITSKKGQSRIPGLVKDASNAVFDNPQDIVDSFARFFQSVYVDSTNTDIDPDFNNAPYIDISEIHDHDVIEASKKLKDKLTSGVDGIPSFVVKDCVYALVDPLIYIYNLILSTHQFPDIWKTARVSPILKKGDTSLVTNYRPISLLCNFSKIFEIILYNYLFNHVRNVISIDQHGFVNARSCMTNLACLSENVCKTLDSLGQVDVIYTDFRKAFDRIDHYVLLNKLDGFGLSERLTNVFKSYLLGRTQFVEIEGFRSEAYVATSGVPQGSNLGPLMFIMFINDLLSTITCSKLAYADDLKLYHNISNSDDCVFLQDNLNALSRWCVNNSLGLNLSKCNVVSFSRLKAPLTYGYTIDETALNRLDQITDLGIIFDAKFTFIPQFDNLTRSANRVLGFIIRNSRDFTNESTIKLLYYCFVRSKLDYGGIIWNPIYACHVNSVESVQRRFLKYLVFKCDGVYPERGCDHSLLLTRFDELSLFIRRRILLVKFLFNLFHNIVDCPFLLSNISLLVPRLNARLSQTFFLDTPRTNILFQSPLYMMCHAFNGFCGICDIHNSPISLIVEALVGTHT